MVRSLQSYWPQHHLHIQQPFEDHNAVLQQMHFMESAPHDGKHRCTIEAAVALYLVLVHHPHVYYMMMRTPNLP